MVSLARPKTLASALHVILFSSFNATADEDEVVETIYSMMVFGAGQPVEMDDGAVLAEIPFSGHGSGVLKLVYVQIVDENGDPILELSGSELEDAIPYDLGEIAQT